MRPRTKLLQIVTATTQGLDFTIPLLYHLHLHQREIYSITILYCSLNRVRFTRDSGYYSNLDRILNVKSIDLSDFQAFKSSLLVRIYRFLIRTSVEDTLSIGDYLRNVRLFGLGGTRYLFGRLKKQFEDFIVGRLLRPADIIEILDPDIVLLDNRATFKIKAARELAKYIADSGKKTVVIPHAPHGNNAHDEFMPLGKSDHFPGSVEYWGILNAARPNWPHNQEGTSRFFVIGFTALDSNWRVYMEGRRKSTASHSDRVRILYLPEKIRGKADNNKKEQVDLVAYEEELRMVKRILFDLDQSGMNYEFIIKPHPRISSATIINLVRDLSHSSVKYSPEPLYCHLERTDFAIAGFSSAILYCACYVPVLLITGRLYEEVRRYWYVLDELYSNISYRYDQDTLNIVLKSLRDHNLYDEIVMRNREHLARLYAADAVDRACARLRQLNQATANS